MPCTSQETKLEVEAMLCTINFQVPKTRRDLTGKMRLQPFFFNAAILGLAVHMM